MAEPHTLSAAPPGRTSLRGKLARFRSSWRRHATTQDGDICEQVFQELNNLYEGEHRYYHGPGHIQHCLERLDEARERDRSRHGGKLGEQQLSLIELAVWFHDAIYTAGDTDNESQSADWFKNRARDALDHDSVTRINSLIEATAHSSKMPSGDLEKLMVDIDLSSFALHRTAFLQDGSNIRQEFDNLSDSDFVKAQSAFLRKLLDRPSIYSTDWYSRHCEADARKNIEVLLEMYEQGFKPALLS